MEEVDEIAANNDCECDEVLDAAITYKLKEHIQAIYQKIGNRLFEREQSD